MATTDLNTEVTTLVKRFGRKRTTNLDNHTIATINDADLQVSGTDLDIIVGMFDRDEVIASKAVKEMLAILLMETAELLEISIDDVLKYTEDKSLQLTATELSLSLINRLRPLTSQMGVTVTSATPAKTVHVNRNILA
jgi:hypothetical protein|tara:strand:- start:1226 stop:1639 length:414 start_codon:yes stop_codon:yes gene_type:complete